MQITVTDADTTGQANAYVNDKPATLADAIKAISTGNTNVYIQASTTDANNMPITMALDWRKAIPTPILHIADYTFTGSNNQPLPVKIEYDTASDTPIITSLATGDRLPLSTTFTSDLLFIARLLESCACQLAIA